MVITINSWRRITDKKVQISKNKFVGRLKTIRSTLGIKSSICKILHSLNTIQEKSRQQQLDGWEWSQLGNQDCLEMNSMKILLLRIAHFTALKICKNPDQQAYKAEHAEVFEEQEVEVDPNHCREASHAKAWTNTDPYSHLTMMEPQLKLVLYTKT